MADVFRDMVNRRDAQSISDELVKMLRGMSDRYGRGATMAGLEHGVGTFCDGIGPHIATYLAASLVGVDPASLRGSAERTAARRLVV